MIELYTYIMVELYTRPEYAVLMFPFEVWRIPYRNKRPNKVIR